LALSKKRRKVKASQKVVSEFTEGLAKEKKKEPTKKKKNGSWRIIAFGVADQFLGRRGPIGLIISKGQRYLEIDPEKGSSYPLEGGEKQEWR